MNFKNKLIIEPLKAITQYARQDTSAIKELNRMIYILTGDIKTGKTTALLKWINGRTDVFGVLSPKHKDSKRYFLNIKTQETFEMQTSSENEDSITVGHYHFFKSAFKTANNIINNAFEKQTLGFIIIDELGKLELRSEGLHQSAVLAIQKTKQHAKLHTIFVVRTTLLEAISKRYDIPKSEKLRIAELFDI